MCPHTTEICVLILQFDGFVTQKDIDVDIQNYRSLFLYIYVYVCMYVCTHVIQHV